MRRKRGADKPEPEVPVNSFSDIAFLLIIFFILATTLTQLQGFYTEIPSGSTSQTQEQAESTKVNLHDGGINFNDKRVSMEQLVSGLQELNLDNKDGNDKVVLLEASGQVDYQLYYQVMTAITNAGGAIAMVEQEGGEQ